MANFTFKSVQFRREREQAWQELEEILQHAERHGLSRLEAEQMHRMPRLHRAALSSLSVARAISLDRRLIAYLEGLATRSYVQVYGVKQTFSSALQHFLAVGLPLQLYRHGRALGIALASVILGLLCGFVLTLEDSEWFYSFVSSELSGERGPLSSREELAEILTQKSSDGLNTFASFLFSHNSRVGVMCFFLGLAAGIPGFMLLFATGLMLGAFAAIHHQQDLDWLLWTWILPHGVTEILAVCVCGAAGFVVGAAFVFPGRHRRLDEVARAGREAGQMVLGAILMFFVAALIEGYFRQLVTAPATRASLIVFSAAFWTWYIAVRGRQISQRMSQRSQVP